MPIRPPEPDDRAAWERMFEAYAAFYHTELPEGGAETVWRWIFDGENPFWCDLWIGDDGQPAGFAHYQLMHRSLGATMTVYLSDLFVDPKQCGSGAGRALLDHVIAVNRARGFTNLRWLTQEGNATARRLYDAYVPRSEFILYSLDLRQNPAEADG